MADDQVQLPEGYKDAKPVKSAQGDVQLPAGYEDATPVQGKENQTTTAAQPKTEEPKGDSILSRTYKAGLQHVDKALEPLDYARQHYEQGKGLGAGLGRFALMIPGMAEDLYHAAVNPATKEEEQETVLPLDPMQRFVKRVLLDPGKQAAQHVMEMAQAKQDRRAAKGLPPVTLGDKLAEYGGEAIASIPLFGPRALQVAERGLGPQHDPTGALTDIAGDVALMSGLPEKVVKEASPGGSLPGAPLPSEAAFPNLTAPVRAVSRGLKVIAPTIPYGAGALAGSEVAGRPFLGGIAGKMLISREAITNLLEKGETFGLPKAEADLRLLEDRAAESAKAHEKAADEYSRYHNSKARGVEPPEDVVKKYEKTKRIADEDRFHADQAREALEEQRAQEREAKNRPEETPNWAAGIAGDLDKEAPRVNPAEPEAKGQGPLRPINVKGPGEVQPEVFPQAPTERPQVPSASATIPLAEEGGVRVGRPKQLGAKEEGAQIPQKASPILLPERTPERPTVLGRIGGQEVRGEVLPPEKPSLQETMKPSKTSGFPEAKVEEVPQEKKEPTFEESLKGLPEAKAPVDRTATGLTEERPREAAPEEKPTTGAVNEKGELTKKAPKGEDALYKNAVDTVRKLNRGSVIALQRNLGISYAKAVELIDRMEEEGVVGPSEGGKAREVLPEKKAATEEKPVRSEEAQEAEGKVSEQVSNLRDAKLKELAKAHGLNPDDYDLKLRDEKRHRTDRTRMVNDIVAKMGDDEVQNIARNAERTGPEASGKSVADKAEALFPRLRGPVDEFGNPAVSGGSQGASPAFDKEAEKLKEHVANTSSKDTDHIQAAMKELGPDAKLSDVMKRAQELKYQAKPVDLRKVGEEHNKAEGLGKIDDSKVEKDSRGSDIAKAYAEMKHEPTNPEVKKSYDALIKDTEKQWNALEKAGIKIQPTDEDPYKSHEEMVNDLEKNKTLKVFRGGNPLPEDHPLAKIDPKTGESYNTMFRAVHDAFGHAMPGNDFSEAGEENAWNTHRQMMSKEAVPAMTTETKGQTSWFFNHGEEPGKFAEQKAGLLPDKYTTSAADAKQALDHIKSGKDFAVITAENPKNTRISEAENVKRNQELLADLRKKGYEPVAVEGHNADVVGQKENSYFVPDITPKDAAELARKHGQSSVLTKEGLHDLQSNFITPSDNEKVITGKEAQNQKYYSTIGGEPFSVPLDFNKEVPAKEGPWLAKNLKEWKAPPELGVTDEGKDVGAKARSEAERRTGGPLKRGEVERRSGEDRRSVQREKQAEADKLFAQARKELGEDATSEQIEKRVEELRKKPSAANARLSDEELLKQGWTKEDLEEGKHLPAVSGGAPEAGAKRAKLPTGDDLIKKYGESDDPGHISFLLKDGRGVAFPEGKIHDSLLGGKATDNLREQFVNNEGAIRMRASGTYGGRNFHLSLPESGISEGQLEKLKSFIPQFKTARVYMEVAKPEGGYKIVDVPAKEFDQRFEKSLRELVPVLNDKGAPIDEFGNPTVSGGSQSAGAAKASKLPKLAEENLRPEEKAGVTKSDLGTKAFVKNLTDLPKVREQMDIAQAGAGGRKWYQRSSKAFDAMHEEAPDYFKPEDKSKFINFLASLSPQQSVAMNLREALHTWKEYVDAGRPEGKALEKLLRDNLTLPETKIPNAMKSLAGTELWPDLSKNQNFKVPSFGDNLNGDLDRATNDGWMALFNGLDAKHMSKASVYHAVSAVTRAAAKELGWETAEAQAAIWAFTKVFTEKGETDPVIVRKYSEDFADIMAHDSESRQLMQNLGVNLDKLDSKLRAIGKKPEVSPRTSPTFENSLGKLTKRIEGARGKGAIPKPKSGYLFYDEEPDEATEFNPEKFRTQTDSGLEPLKKKKSSKLGKIK